MNPEEQARADRFVRAPDRHSFTAAHGCLRLLLGAMLGDPPQSFVLTVNQYGKPRLAEPRGIAFNMSHSGGIVLIGVASNIAIGVDVEALRPVPERSQIVRRYFHPGEAADFATVPEDRAETAFFRCWSRKEAVVKALGRGMSLDLHRYRVACLPRAAPELLALEGETAPRDAWTIYDLDFGARHVGAVAARHRPLTVSCVMFDVARMLG
ncbi:MAG TPA: 4'-phosphopantetheinyl transferase superfamily protein [Stellaceae bacterium]